MSTNREQRARKKKTHDDYEYEDNVQVFLRQIYFVLIERF